MMDSETDRYKELEKRLGIKFKDYSIIEQAFTHSSYVYEKKLDIYSNEKLEFLGDAVLGFGVVDILYRKFPDMNEGDLARLKAIVVSEDFLFEVVSSLSLDKYLKISRGTAKTCSKNKSLIVDSFEALLGAIYLSMGIRTAKSVINKLLYKKIKEVAYSNQIFDYKTALQEVVQKRFKIYPIYRVIREEGPDHDKVFYVQVLVDKKAIAEGVGRSKREAEKAAAKLAYFYFIDENQK